MTYPGEPPLAEDARIERALARLPRWILLLSLAGVILAGVFLGLAVAGGFLAGSIAAYFNLWLVERAVNRITGTTAVRKPGQRAGIWLYIQFAALVSGVVVILRYSGFSMVAALCGFFVCPAAVLLEIVYELVAYEHS